MEFQLPLADGSYLMFANSVDNQSRTQFARVGSVPMAFNKAVSLMALGTVTMIEGGRTDGDVLATYDTVLDWDATRTLVREVGIANSAGSNAGWLVFLLS